MKKQYIFTALLIICLSIIATAQVKRKFTIVGRSDVGSTTLWDGSVIRIYGYASTFSDEPIFPAKTIYVNESDSVFLNVYNISQGCEHTVHVHGMDMETKYDGDPMTGHAIMHLQNRTYPFFAKHAGTYLYHCHVQGAVHVQMGMYGMLIVKPLGGAKTAWTGGPAYDKTYNWLLSEIDKSWHIDIPVPVKFGGDTLIVPKYKPDYFLINGKSETELLVDDSIKIAGSQGEQIYLRTGNMGYYSNQIVFPSVLNATIIDSDGRPLPSAIRNDTLIVMPGERYGVMLNGSAQYTGTINVSYSDMNTDSIWNTQKVPVTISGFLSVKDNKVESQVSIYPNPASDILYVTFKNYESKNLQYSIINQLGQVVKQEKLNNITGNFSTNINNLNNGIYFVKIEFANNSIYEKIVISK